MLRYIPLHLATCLMCLMLVSCAAIKEKTTIEPAGWLEQQQERRQVKFWEVRGRLGIQTQVTGGSMDIIWKQSRKNYTIRLILPLGVGSYLIQGNNNYAEIRYPNGYKRIVNNIDNVFSSVLEVNIPFSSIKDWIRGLPAKSLPIKNIQWDEQDMLSTVKQAGWSVELTNYTGNEILMPHTIYLSRDDNAELDIRLVLSQWLVDN